MDRRITQAGNGFAVSRDLTPQLVATADCKPLGRETRKHPQHQLRKLAANLERFGFVAPIVVDAKRQVVAGWGLVLAARQLGLNEVPAVCIADLPEAELRLLRLALNRLTEDSDWDHKNLQLELSDIIAQVPQIEIESSGFAVGEIDALLHGTGADQDDELPAVAEDGERSVTQPGDLWICGEHCIYCGDARSPESYTRVLGTDKAQMTFADPPYNVPGKGPVCGLGKTKHADFAMASGGLSEEGFQEFLQTCLGHAARSSSDGGLALICMDWRHQSEMLGAGKAVYSELKNVCIWNKPNAGMASLYRSKYEFVFVYKIGKGRHINNVALGRHGRNRTNVWDYGSQNCFGSKSKLSIHRTAKPVALVADAICDCSNRGGLILDPFGGTGTTLIAAERTGRRARLIELDPAYVDVCLERWQRSGGTAVHAETGQPFSRGLRFCKGE